jgi:hypothetical protein
MTKKAAGTIEKKKPGGRTVGNWRVAALAELGEIATPDEIAAKINAYAGDSPFDYTTTGDEVKAWRATGKSRPRTRGTETTQAKREPTLSDLLAVKERIGADGRGLVEAIRLVSDLSDEVGGLDILRRCVDALEKLKA